MYVNAKEFSKVIHALGHSNDTAKPGILHSPPGFNHTAFIGEDDSYDGDITYDGINPPMHHINDKHLHLLED